MEALLLFFMMLFPNPSTESTEQTNDRIRVENSVSNARDSNTVEQGKLDSILNLIR